LADLIRRVDDTEHDLRSSADQPFEKMALSTISNQTGSRGHTFNQCPQKSATKENVIQLLVFEGQRQRTTSNVFRKID
jgi:hypothetical protein